jgi:N-acylglucosamine-6-phosphate 2-epimerase
VFAEGRYWTPEQAVQAFELGASFVVVGTAITNPMAITSRFIKAIGNTSNDKD